MSDLDIGIPFNDAPPRNRAGQHRRRRRGGEGRGRSLAALVVMLTVFALLAGGAWYGYSKVKDFFTAPDYAGQGSGNVSVVVEQGDSAGAIANTLYKQGVVKSAKAFTQACEDDSRSREIQPGNYTLRKEMKASLALALLLDPASKNVNRYTIPEGKSSRQIFTLLSKQTGIPLAAFQTAAKDTASLGLPPWAKGNLEGFLYPDTYEKQKDDTAASILKGMVARSVGVLEAENFEARAAERNLPPYEALIVASLVEGEGIPSDFAKIARVVYNRQKEDMPLEFDSTTNYGREIAGKPRKNLFTRAELRDPNNKWSTHTGPGLPPTPIANPGKAALEAAVAPAAGDWLFFVLVDKKGNSAFANTLPQHETNVEKCKDIGLC